MEKTKQKMKPGQAVVKALKWFLTSFIWLGIIMIALDVVSKILFFFLLGEGNSITVIPGFLRFSVILNYNAAFGLGSTDAVLNRVMYIIVALIGLAIITGIMIVKYRKLPKLVRASLMLMAAGALGNLIDRVFYSFSGYAVIDWIDFYGIWKFVFNVADSAVVVGTIILIIWLIVSEVKDIQAKKALVNVDGKVLSADEKDRIEASTNSEEVSVNNENDDTK